MQEDEEGDADTHSNFSLFHKKGSAVNLQQLESFQELAGRFFTALLMFSLSVCVDFCQVKENNTQPLTRGRIRLLSLYSE